VASDLEYAWAAGFFDGEGTTSILKAQRDKYSYLRMSVSQKNRALLDKFQKIVGVGKVYKSKTREIHSWDCYKKQDVEVALSLLWPHLSKQKRDQAENARTKVLKNSKESSFYDNRNLPDWPSSFGLAPVLKEGTTVCSFCRFTPDKCVCRV